MNRLLPARVLRLIPALTCLAVTASAAETPEAFFEKKIRPLLEQHCLECHSAGKKVKGGLRLDYRRGWETGGDAGTAVVPGDSENSLILKAVRYADVDLQMPPRRKLPAADIAAFEEWVRMGAPDPRTEDPSLQTASKASRALPLEKASEFWAYRPVEVRALPAVSGQWPEGRVDTFLKASMDKAGVEPVGDAPALTVLRRLHFALTGLPPGTEAMLPFADAYARNPASAVGAEADRLLSTEGFAEHFARRWLDLTRFAESSGGGRTLLFKDAWRFRDYVIEALHADRPMNRFIQEHIAGDLMQAHTPEEKARLLTATGFLLLGPNNYEEQDKQQLRFDIIDEQIDTIGKAFLGQTLGCARCHDHKFDPIPQSDYYAVAGIFASTRSLHNLTDNVARWVAVPLPGFPEEERLASAHAQKIASLKKNIEQLRAQIALNTPRADEESTIRAAVTRTERNPLLDARKLPGIVMDDSEARLVGEWKKSTFSRRYVGENYLSDMNSGKGEKSVTFTPVFARSGRYEVRLGYPPGPNRSHAVSVTVFHADGEETLSVDQTKEPSYDGLFTSLGTYRFEKDGSAYVLVSNAGDSGYVVVDAVQFLPESAAAEQDVPGSAATPPGPRRQVPPQKRSDTPAPLAGESRDAVQPATDALQRQLTQLSAELKELEKAAPRRSTTMAVMDQEKIEDTQIRIRGVAKQKGSVVPRGVLRAVSVPGSGGLQFGSDQSGRLEFAQWLVDDRNPLTARVLVNHVWAWVFGRGLVPTTENFGTTGEPPTHPELLDDLTIRFVQQGWSLKKLVRELVVSHAWRLAEAPPDSRDLRNALWSRHQPRRLDADQIRDALLQAAGRLNRAFLGPNIAGAGEIDANTTSAQNVEYKYVFEDERRSLYTPAFRNRRPDIFEAFDFGDTNNPVGVRETSTVAPQALFFLNSPFVARQAHAAGKLFAEAGEPFEATVSRMAKTILGREILPAETKALDALFQKVPAGESPDLRYARVAHALFASIDFRYLR